MKPKQKIVSLILLLVLMCLSGTSTFANEEDFPRVNSVIYE